MSVQEAIAAGLTTQEIQNALVSVNEAREEFNTVIQNIANHYSNVYLINAAAYIYIP